MHWILQNTILLEVIRWSYSGTVEITENYMIIHQCNLSNARQRLKQTNNGFTEKEEFILFSRPMNGYNVKLIEL